MQIGKIVGSTSHISYEGRVFTAREVNLAPRPADYALGRFVWIKIRALAATAPADTHDESQVGTSITYAVGIISNTMLLSPAATGGDLHLFKNEELLEMFSPDALAERVTQVSILLLGTMKARRAGEGMLHIFEQRHGVPLFALELGSIIETMPEEDVRAFHLFEALHFGYLPHMQTQPNSLLPMVILQVIDQLERLFPAHLAMSAIIKRNFAWRLKIERLR
jgi:hypothetical protein